MNTKRNEVLSQPVKLSTHLTVGPQPNEEMLRELAKQGYKTLINLANKGEFRLNFSPDEEEALATEVGMAYRHFPVSMVNMKAEQAEAFCELVRASEKPVYIHCRLGQRSGPFGLIYHALHRKLSFSAIQEKKERLGFNWQAPMLDSFIKSTIEHGQKATESCVKTLRE